MQDISVFWLRVAAAFYLPGLIYAILVVLRRNTGLFRYALNFFAAGAMLHLVSIVDLARPHGCRSRLRAGDVGFGFAGECGFGTATSLRAHFQRQVHCSPQAYRNTFAIDRGAERSA